MLPAFTPSSTSPFLVRVAGFAYEKLLRLPLVGVAHLVVGAVQTVVPLVRATTHAASDIVHSYLLPNDQAAIEHGIERMSIGAALLAWPLAVLGTVLFWRQPLLQAMLAIGLFGLALS